MRPCKVKLCQRNELKMGSSDHDSQKIPAMMMYEIKMTIFGRVELSSAIYRGPSECQNVWWGQAYVLGISCPPDRIGLTSIPLVPT